MLEDVYSRLTPPKNEDDNHDDKKEEDDCGDDVDDDNMDLDLFVQPRNSHIMNLMSLKITNQIIVFNVDSTCL